MAKTVIPTSRYSDESVAIIRHCWTVSELRAVLLFRRTAIPTIIMVGLNGTTGSSTIGVCQTECESLGSAACRQLQLIKVRLTQFRKCVCGVQRSRGCKNGITTYDALNVFPSSGQLLKLICTCITSRSRTFAYNTQNTGVIVTY